MAFATNRAGKLVQVPEAYFLDTNLWLTRACFSEFYRKKPVGKILLFRNTGGLGDLITLLPSVRALSKEATSEFIDIAVPEQFFFIFESSKVNLISFQFLESRFKEFIKRYDSVVDLFCPCGVHESEVNYKISKSRVENFAQALFVPPAAPVLKFHPNDKVPKKKFNILFQLRSANVTKDWPIDNYKALASMLGPDVFCATVDKDFKIQGIPAIVGKSLRELPSYIANFDLVVGPDSGILHLAAAMGIKTLWFFGPTSAPLTLKHYTKAFAVVGKKSPNCSMPCYYSKTFNGFHCATGPGPCLTSILPEVVFNKCKEILDA